MVVRERSLKLPWFVPLAVAAGLVIACGDSQSAEPTAAVSSSPAASPTSAPVAESPTPTAIRPPVPETLPPEGPVVVDEQALASDSLFVYTSARNDGGVDILAYSRDRQRLIGGFGVTESVRPGAPRLLGRNVVMPLGRSVAVLDLQGRLVDALATLADQETVLGLAPSRSGEMLAIGIESMMVREDSRLVVLELAGGSELLRISLPDYDDFIPFQAAPVPEAWLPGDRAVELSFEVGKDGIYLPGATMALDGAISKWDFGARQLSDDGGRAVLPMGRIGACQGVAVWSTGVRLMDTARERTIAEFSEPTRAVRQYRIAPTGEHVLFNTAPIVGECADTSAPYAWYLLDASGTMPVGDVESVLHDWYADGLVEVECAGVRSVSNFSWQREYMDCDDNSPAGLWLDGIQVDTVDVAGFVGFVN